METKKGEGIVKLRKIKPNKNNEYQLNVNTINVISGKAGILYLPYVETLSQLQVIFTEKGEFTIDGNGVNIHLGMTNCPRIEINPGSPTFDTIPMFVYSDEKWFVLTLGNIIIPDEVTP